jgi:hypothetical protein
MARIEETEEPDDATAFTDMFLTDVQSGEETLESLEELQEATAHIMKLAGRDPESTSYYAALTTTIYILRQS